MEGNLEKKMHIVFSKATKLDISKFFYNNSEIETVRPYIYLGIKFHAPGSFTEAKRNLNTRGLKAFKFCKAFNGVKPNMKTFFHIFDHAVKPVVLYGSEIRGFMTNYKKLYESSAEDFFFKLCNGSIFEKIHLKACKSFLCINRRSTNLAVVGEAGRYPIMFEIIITMLKYYKQVCSSEAVLLMNAYKKSPVAHEEDKLFWVGCVKTVLKFLDVGLFFSKQS